MNIQSNPDDELSVKDVFQILWRNRWFIAITTLVFALATAVFATVSVKKYDAIVVVSPVAEESGGSRLGSMVSQLSGLSALSGLAGIAPGSSTQKSETVAVLQSEALTEAYISENNLLPVLYAKYWDGKEHRWNVTDPEKLPTVWKANVFFRNEVRSVATDTKTGLVTVTIRWRDPMVAAKWANDLIKMTNDYLRKKTIDEAERNIAYLNSEAAKTEAVGVKEAIYTILQNEIKKMMLARGSEEYALKVVDPAVAPEKAATPKRLIWTLVGTILGLVLAMSLVGIVHWWKTA